MILLHIEGDFLTNDKNIVEFLKDFFRSSRIN